MNKSVRISFLVSFLITGFIYQSAHPMFPAFRGHAGTSGFGVDGSVTLSPNAKIGLLLGASAALLLLPFEVRFVRWIAFNLKSQATLENEARVLMSGIKHKYKNALAFAEHSSEFNEADKQATIKKIVMDRFSNYQFEENGWKETFRKWDWFTSYRFIADFPYAHFINRIENTTGWLTWYRQRLTYHPLSNEIALLITQLSSLRAFARSTYEAQQETGLIKIAQMAATAAAR